MKISVDVDQLREGLLDRAGSAAGVGFPDAMLDVMDMLMAAFESRPISCYKEDGTLE